MQCAQGGLHLHTTAAKPAHGVHSGLNLCANVQVNTLRAALQQTRTESQETERRLHEELAAARADVSRFDSVLAVSEQRETALKTRIRQLNLEVCRPAYVQCCRLLLNWSFSKPRF